MGLKIISPGLLTTVQDLGRRGHMSTGFQVSGAMDRRSMLIANILADNHDNTPVLEMTALGISAEFTSFCYFVLTGADMQASLNDKPVKTYKVISADKGDVLSMRSALSGCRAYLSVCGGFAVDPVMGSCSTNLKCGFGGFCGRKLKAGDLLEFRHEREFIGVVQNRQISPAPVIGQKYISVRVIPGPQDDMFTAKGLSDFFGSAYSVSNKSDRMGIRLDGPKVEAVDQYDIISDGIAEGSVQIPKAGTPIIMMADRQTVGGYAKIATVISVDIPLLAQASPCSTVRFIKTDLSTAQKLAAREKRELSLLKYEMMRQ